MICKEAMKAKGFRVNEGKTTGMVCDTGLDVLQSSGAFPFAVLCACIGNNSTCCYGGKLWVREKCRGRWFIYYPCSR